MARYFVLLGSGEVIGLVISEDGKDVSGQAMEITEDEYKLLYPLKHRINQAFIILERIYEKLEEFENE